MPFTEPQRLKALPPYLFVEIDRKKRALAAAGKDVINFGVGDPDQPTHDFIIDALKHAVHNPEHHRYPLGQGSVEFRKAMAAFFARRYDVRLDPDSQVLCLIGSKEGLGHLPLAMLNPGDVALIPNPGYPVYQSGTIFAGGVPHEFRLLAERGWLPDLTAISSDVARKAVVMFINYPNNPTGATATLDFYREAVAFAKNYDLIICQDAAYNEMHLGNVMAPSILQAPGAIDCAIELHSLSKTFNMTGWRLGFAVGHAGVLAALGRIKNNLDSGAFTAIQDAGSAAYAGLDRPELHATRTMYAERATTMVRGLRELGFDVREPQATFYIWAGVPRGYDSMGVVNRLLDEAHVVCIPGTGFGSAGEGYVRFALTVPVERARVALERMRKITW